MSQIQGFAIEARARQYRTDFPRNYKQACARLGKRVSRKLSHNTYLVARGEDRIAVRLHETDIVTFHSDGSATLDSGGWQTPTTRGRMRSCGFGVYMSKGIAQIGDVSFRDEMRIGPRGGISGGGVLWRDAVKARARALRIARRTGGIAWYWPTRSGGWVPGGNAPEAFAVDRKGK